MTPSAGEPGQRDPAAGAVHLLLQASLERRLSAEEAQQLRAAASADPAVADDVAVYELLRAARLEQRMARHEASSWDQFQQLARQHAGAARTHAQTAGAGGWRGWLQRQGLLPGQGLPRLAALCAGLVIAVQAGGLVWLMQRPADPARMRGAGAPAACPAVLVRLNPQASASDFARVLMQAGARVVDGPDARGAFRVVGPGAFAEEAGALLADLSQDVRRAPDCAP